MQPGAIENMKKTMTMMKERRKEAFSCAVQALRNQTAKQREA